MFQFRRFPTYGYLIHRMLTDSSSAGFPHSDIHGSQAAFALPWLFVDRYVLRRLLVPRHSPYALSSLTILGPMLESFGSLGFSLDDKNVVLVTLKYFYHFTFTCALFSFQGTNPDVRYWTLDVRSNSLYLSSLLYSVQALFP